MKTCFPGPQPASQSRVGKSSTFLILSSNFDQFFLFFLKLFLFSSSFWPSGWATRPPGKALATPLGFSLTLLSTLVALNIHHLLKGTSVFFLKTVRVCHVCCNFKIGFTCRITVIFGILKDESLLINTLASNICFSYRNIFQNGVDALPKIVDAFLSKSSNFHLVQIIR